MRFLIESIENNQVCVRSPFGTMLCHWYGVIPSPGECWEAEIDCPTALSIRLAASIGLSTGFFSGVAEAWEKDILFLRIGTDLVMVSTEEDCASFVGKRVAVTVPEITLFPHLQVT